MKCAVSVWRSLQMLRVVGAYAATLNVHYNIHATQEQALEHKALVMQEHLQTRQRKLRRVGY